MINQLPNLLITAVDKHYWPILSHLPPDTRIVIHDPTELKTSTKNPNPLVQGETLLNKYKVLTIRETVQRYLLDNFLQYLGKDDLIIYHQSGSYLLRDVNGAVDSQKTFDDNYFKVDYENLDIIRKYLNLLAKKTFAEIVWVGPFVEYRYNPKEVVRLPKTEFISKLKINPASIRLFNLLEDEIGAVLNKDGKSFDYLSFNEIYKVNSRAFIKSGDSSLCFQFADRDHFSNCGENEASKNLEMKAFQLITR